MKLKRNIKINGDTHTIRNSRYVYLRVKPALSYLKYSKLYNIIAYSYVFIENL